MLNELERIGSKYPELYDTDVRESLGIIILNILNSEDSLCEIPNEYGMFSDEANLEIKKLLELSIKKLWESNDYNLASHEERFAVFSSTEIQSETGQFLEDFIGDLSFRAVIKQEPFTQCWLEKRFVYFGFIVMPCVFLLTLIYFIFPQIFSNKVYLVFTVALIAFVSLIIGAWLWGKLYTIIVRNKA